MINVNHLEDEDFSCPVCNHPVAPMDEPCDPCDHVAFIYLDSIGEFEYTTGAFEDLENIDLIEDDFIDVLKDFKIKDVYQLTYNGLACGPVSFDVTIGIKE